MLLDNVVQPLWEQIYSNRFSRRMQVMLVQKTYILKAKQVITGNPSERMSNVHT